MKGNFDDDDRISSKDAQKINLDQIYWCIFNKLSSFLSSFACLLIGVNQEVAGTTLHKEKNAKETIEATAQTKNISHSQEYKLYRNATVLLTFFK